MFVNFCVKSLRKQKGWSVYRLAKEAGVSRSQVTNIENGKNTSMQTFMKILEALDVQDAQISRRSTGYGIFLNVSANADKSPPIQSRKTTK
jgi:transcriptional regulator with XRE-family HTH domain